MKHRYIDAGGAGLFALNDFSCSETNALVNEGDYFRIFWMRGRDGALSVDGADIPLAGNQMLFLTPLNQLAMGRPPEGAVAFVFNREFYCVKDHDREVSCAGLLFYGSAGPVIVTLDRKEEESLDRLYGVFLEEFETADHIQGEMLEMLLKRLIIKATRRARAALPDPSIPDAQLDLVRRYNMLVEEHFREKHRVSDYAELLFKSPKTLSNSFRKYGDQTPLDVIHDRIVLEAKRLLLYSNRSAEEVAFTLGFDDPAHFSRFFKRRTGTSPSQFRSVGKK